MKNFRFKNETTKGKNIFFTPAEEINETLKIFTLLEYFIINQDGYI